MFSWSYQQNTRWYVLCPDVLILNILCYLKLYFRCFMAVNEDGKVEEVMKECLRNLDPLLQQVTEKDQKWRATIVLIWVSASENKHYTDASFSIFMGQFQNL